MLPYALSGHIYIYMTMYCVLVYVCILYSKYSTRKVIDVNTMQYMLMTFCHLNSVTLNIFSGLNRNHGSFSGQGCQLLLRVFHRKLCKMKLLRLNKQADIGVVRCCTIYKIMLPMQNINIDPWPNFSLAEGLSGQIRSNYIPLCLSF